MTIEKTSSNTSFVINETSKANSLEIGKPNNRFKLYFDTAEDLSIMIKNLKALGLYQEEGEIK